MARISIELPEDYAFSTELQLYISHINYGNHLDNAQLLGLVGEARLRYFRAFGHTELDVDGLGILVADVAAQYRREAFHGDVLVVRLAPVDFNRYGCDLVWQVSDKASDQEVARGKHGIVFFDYSERKLAPVPAAFLRMTRMLERQD